MLLSLKFFLINLEAMSVKFYASVQIFPIRQVAIMKIYHSY